MYLLHGKFVMSVIYKNQVKITRSLIILVKSYTTKYIYFILMKLVKCTKMYLLHGKFDNVGNIKKNNVKMTKFHNFGRIFSYIFDNIYFIIIL